MKKQYNTPASKLINITAEGFLCTSYGTYDEVVTDGWSNKKEQGSDIWNSNEDKTENKSGLWY